MKFYVGWELEFQQTDIYDINDGFNEYVEQIKNLKVDLNTACLWRRVHAMLNINTSEWYSYRDMNVKEFISEHIPEEKREELISHIREFAEDHARGSYRDADDKEFNLELPAGVEFVKDASVGGGELRPTSKNTVPRAKQLLRELESSYSFSKFLKVDEECSFHVHVSVEDIKPKYGTNIQGFMLQYLSRYINEVPLSVLTRWGSDTKDWRQRYFDIALDNNKYRFVAYRGRSWEFRCFGNIQTADEGEKCIDLAVRAYRWAHNQVKLGKKFTKEHIIADEIIAKANARLKKAKVA